jgi:hypothetical protein
MVHDGVIMTAAADRRLAVGDNLGEFEQKNLLFLLWTASKMQLARL